MGLARLALISACLLALPAAALGQADTSPPDTAISFGPSSFNTSDAPRFEFSATEGGATFECRLDAAPFAPCSSPHTLSGLPLGEHQFEVRAIDPAGNVDPTPAQRKWKRVADIKPPKVTFDGPSSLSIRKLRRFSGRALSASDISRVDVALRVYGRRRTDENGSLVCEWIDLLIGEQFSQFCLAPSYLRARVRGDRWTLTVPKRVRAQIKPGFYVLQVRAVNELVAGKVYRRRLQLRR